MATSLKAPEQFSFDSTDLANQWNIWRRQFEWYFLATNDEAEDNVKVAILITLLGAEGLA